MNRNSTPKSAGCPRLTESFPTVLQFLATSFPTALIDPGNSNNVVSDLLTDVEKLHIARRAARSLGGGLPASGAFSPRGDSSPPKSAVGKMGTV